MVYEIICTDPNGEKKTLIVQDTDNIKISIEYQESGNFLTFANDFNQQAEKSSDMDNLFNFLSKKDTDFSISVNVNENKFSYATFKSITNIKYAISLNPTENKRPDTKLFTAMVQAEFKKGDEV